MKRLFLILQIFFFAASVLALWGADQLELPILTSLGVAGLGATFSVLALEALVTRQTSIPIGRRTMETYTGLAALAYGFIFAIYGMFFFGLAYAFLASTGSEIFEYFIRRPGAVLFLIGITLLLMAIVAISGSVEDKYGERWVVFLNLITSRLLPGLILTVLGLGALLLGFYEFTSPSAFDNMGGGLLEALFLRSGS